VKTLAEQPARMRRRTVIMARQRPPALARCPDMPEIAALRSVTGERALFHRRLVGGELDRDLAIVAIRELVRAHPGAGEIVGGEFVNRQEITELRRERVGGVVVLVRTFEGRNPELARGIFSDCAAGFGRRGVEMMAQPARRVIEKPDRFTNQRCRGAGLLAPARHPRGVAAALPGP